MLIPSSTTAAVSPSATTPRARFAATSTRRRSMRSTSAPATSENTSQGSVATTDRPAIATGERVSRIATSGSATASTPSARFERLDALSSRQNAGGRRSRSADTAAHHALRTVTRT
jgi:hypothetical protein